MCHIFKLFILSLISFYVTQPLIAALPKGSVKVSQVNGSVFAVKDDTDLKYNVYNGQILEDGYTITTGKDSSCVLIFSNGSHAIISNDTSLSISDYKQEAYNQSIGQFDLLKADPSQSQTNLTLNYGELIVDVKKLSPKSSFDVTTQAGVAGIRGTVASTAFSLNPLSGEFSMNIINVSGDVSSTTYNVAVDDTGSESVEKIISQINSGAKTVTTGVKNLDSGAIISSNSISAILTEADKVAMVATITNANVIDTTIMATVENVQPALIPLKAPAQVIKNAQSDLRALEKQTAKSFNLSLAASEQIVSQSITESQEAQKASTPQSGTIDNSIVDGNEFEESPSTP